MVQIDGEDDTSLLALCGLAVFTTRIFGGGNSPMNPNGGTCETPIYIILLRDKSMMVASTQERQESAVQGTSPENRDRLGACLAMMHETD